MIRILDEKYYEGTIPCVDAFGLSTDAKPTGVLTGSTFYEVDTSKAYVYDEVGQTWNQVTAEIDSAAISDAVNAWLVAHPEATTTVTDGSITYAKLNSSLQGSVDTVSSLSEEIATLRGTIESVSNNVGVLSIFSNFVNGSLLSGGIDTTKAYRIASTDIIDTTESITLTIASGFRIDRHIFSSGTYSGSSGWQTGTITIPADRHFKVCIARTSEDTTETADIDEFLNAVTFDTGIKKDIDALDTRLDTAESNITTLQATLIIKSDNLYNPALQTAETIDPHYYWGGVPYSSTQFDGTWNCTALIEVEPNTQYTVGLVPAINDVTKPWNAAGAGGFCYDESGTYISGTSFTGNTFTTTSATKYIRFNYQITNGFSLSELNARCMLVKGGTLPSTYEAFIDTTLSEYVQTIDTKVDEIDSRTKNVLPLWYKRTGTTIEISHAYNNDNDVVVTMQKFGGNDLFDLKSVNTIAKDGDPASAARTQIWSNPSDAFSPYVVAAVNNADGDDQNTTFTGGQHQYNNTGSGSTATARTASISFYADNVAVADGGTGRAKHFRIVWENRVQGWNTKKADGTGREILKVVHTADFDGNDIKVSTNIYPLEDVKMATYYGFQFYAGSLYPNIRYLSSTNRLVNTIESSSSSSNSGDLDGYSFRAENTTDGNLAEVSIDPLFDLGKRDCATGQNAMFVSYNKVYFSIVRNETTMAEGSLYSLKGAYKFAPID